MLYGCQTNNGSFVIKLIIFYIHRWLKGGWGAWSWLNQYTDIQWRLFVRIHYDNGITCRITWWMGRGRGGVSQSTPFPLIPAETNYIYIYTYLHICVGEYQHAKCVTILCVRACMWVCVCVWVCAHVGGDVYVIWWSQTTLRDLFVCSAARKNRNVIKMCLFAWERKK